MPCPVLGPSPEVGEDEVDVGVGEMTGPACCGGGECWSGVGWMLHELCEY